MRVGFSFHRQCLGPAFQVRAVEHFLHILHSGFKRSVLNKNLAGALETASAETTFKDLSKNNLDKTSIDVV